MGWLGRSLGQFGSDVGTGVDISKNWAERDQQMKIAAARQKMQELMLPLQLQQLQGEIAKMNNPQFRGTVGTSGGGVGAIMTSPTGQPSITPLQPGADKNTIKAQIASLAQKAPKEYQDSILSLATGIDAGEDPLDNLGKAQQVLAKAADKEQTKEDRAKLQFDPEKGIITDKNKQVWSIYDPNLPPELKNIVDSERKRKKEDDERKAKLEAQKTADALSRAIQVGDHREAAKQYDNVMKMAQRGLSGHSFLKTVQNQVDAARASGGQGTTSGDLALVEGYMQLMFGIDPKALRGSPKMMEMMLKQGGADDRAIAWMNSIRSGGRLSQDVREEILNNAKEQVQSWDAPIQQMSQIVDEPKTKALVDRYLSVTATGDKPKQSDQKNPNDLSDLGGKPAPPVN